MGKNVYDPKQRSYRVDFACCHILRRGGDSRTFDTCFEMGDAEEVAARVYRRALKNQRLMELLPKYLDLAMCRRDYDKRFGGKETQQ